MYETTFIKVVEPICKEHNICLKPEKKHTQKRPDDEDVYRCPKCGIGVTFGEITRHCYAPHFWNQNNPFVIFK